jgi:hypothetical protein
MDDVPWHRNPFKSIHAIALANLAELSRHPPVFFSSLSSDYAITDDSDYFSGLGMMTAMQHAPGVRGIVKRFPPLLPPLFTILAYHD